MTLTQQNMLWRSSRSGARVTESAISMEAVAIACATLATQPSQKSSVMQLFCMLEVQSGVLKLMQRSLRDDSVQVAAFSCLRNDHVTELLAYCVEGPSRVLAYEFAPFGSLHEILHGLFP